MLKTSKAYGKAIFAHALEHDSLNSWQVFLQQLSQIDHPALKNPTLNKTALMSVFEEVLELSDAQRVFLSLLIKNQHTKGLQAILNAFNQHYLKHQQITPVIIRTARQLVKKDQNSIVSSLEKKMGTTVQPDFQVNPSLIGGVQFEVNSKLFDHSFSHILKQIHPNNR